MKHGTTSTFCSTLRSSLRIFTDWTVPVGGLVATVFWYRFLKPSLDLKKYDFKVAAIIPETHDVNSVIISGKNLARLRALAGQFVIVRFFDKGFWWEAHPFSLSEMPKGDRLRLSIKAVGDFTQKIPSLRVGTPVRVEGPLGRFTVDRARREKILLIAGGIGITPLRSLFEQFAQMQKDVELIYAARSDQDFALKNELDSLSQLHARVHYVPGDKMGQLMPEMIKSLVSDVADRSVYLCGPPPMMKAVRQQLESLGVPRKHIMYEKFQLG
jgi:ferredoxin-NADP reductase